MRLCLTLITACTIVFVRKWNNSEKRKTC
jgi:hypothetical protein